MLCAHCGEDAPQAPCSSCGSDPLLKGRYRLLSIRGQGGSGTTYRAQDTQSDDIVAVKELPLRPGTPDKQVQLFEREAVVLSELSHPHIPAYLDHFSAGRGKHRALYLVQQFIDGTDLQDAVEQRRYSAEEVLQLLLPVCDALAYLHGLSPPVIHRDLKPRNLIQRADGQVFLVDFGSVRDALADVDFGGSTVAGTFGFMAPEQFRGEATAETDLYGAGAVAVALLSRKPLHSLLSTQRQLDWAPHVHVPQGVARLLADLLQPNPSARPRTAAEVRERIQQMLEQGLDAPAPVAASTTALARVEETPITALGPTYQPSAVLGAPRDALVEKRVPATVRPDQHSRITTVLEQALDRHGQVDAVGELYRWSSLNNQGLGLRVRVADQGDGTTVIRAFEVGSQRAGGFWAMPIIGGSLGVVGGTLALAALPVATGVGVAVAAAGALTGGGVVFSRWWYPGQFERDRAELERAVDTVAAVLLEGRPAAPAAPPPRLPAPPALPPPSDAIQPVDAVPVAPQPTTALVAAPHGTALAEPVNSRSNPLLGAPTQVNLQRVVRGSLDPALHARMTACIESALHCPGRVEGGVGELYRWATLEKDRRMVRISAMDLGDGTVRLQAWERMSGHAGGLMGGAVSSGFSAGIAAGVAAGAMGVLALAPVLVGGTLLGTSLGYGWARVTFPRTYRTREVELSRALDDLTLLIEVANDP